MQAIPHVSQGAEAPFINRLEIEERRTNGIRAAKTAIDHALQSSELMSFASPTLASEVAFPQWSVADNENI